MNAGNADAPMNRCASTRPRTIDVMLGCPVTRSGDGRETPIRGAVLDPGRKPAHPIWRHGPVGGGRRRPDPDQHGHVPRDRHVIARKKCNLLVRAQPREALEEHLDRNLLSPPPRDLGAALPSSPRTAACTRRVIRMIQVNRDHPGRTWWVNRGAELSATNPGLDRSFPDEPGDP